MNYLQPNYSTLPHLLRYGTMAMALSIISFLVVINDVNAQSSGRLHYARMSVAEVLNQAPEFSTFASLLPNTELETQLEGEGNLTVFVPNNDAFAKLSASQVENLIANPSLLDDIVRLHWTPGRIYTGYFYNESYFSPDGMTRLPIRRVNNDTYLGNAKLIMTDISTRNGIIHVIDEVIMPSSQMNRRVAMPRNQAFSTVTKPRPTRRADSLNLQAIYDDSNDSRASADVINLMAQYDDLTMLVDLLQESGLDQVIRDSSEKITIFAPTNEAFGRLDNNTLLHLERNQLALMQLLLTHVIPSEVSSDDLNRFIDTGTTLNNTVLRFSRLNTPMVENARIIVPDLEANNGIIHVVDQVIEISR